MVRKRVVETDSGIQGDFIVGKFDRMQRHLRDKGYIETDAIIKSGIDRGKALEIGPGPGYLGLEWLSKTTETQLKAVEISPDMIAVAKRNAEEYRLTERVEYVQGSGNSIPFGEGTFDAVFTNGSLHEWSDPLRTFDEIWRVLKPNGRYYVSDLKRDMFFLIKWLMWMNVKPVEIRPGLLTSIRAAYTKRELEKMILKTTLREGIVSSNPFGLTLTGIKHKGDS